MDAENLDVQKIYCFGWKPDKKGWWYVATNLVNIGWDEIDGQKLELDLALDVKRGAQNLIMAQFKDVESEVDYIVTFVNQAKRWKLEILDSPTAEIPKEEKQAFFKSECFKRTCDRANQILERSRDTLDKFVTQRLEQGKLIKVNEIKYNQLLKCLHDSELMKNLRLHKAM